MFSNEHMNYLITYSFNFQNEELLSYYISFLRFVFGLFVVLMVIDAYGYHISLQLIFKQYLSDMFGWLCCLIPLYGPRRAISGKLDRNTISLLVKTQNVSNDFFFLLCF